MIKPIKPNVITAHELKQILTNQITGLYQQIDNPLSLSTECAATFKLALLNGALDYINSLGTAGLMIYMRNLRYAQLEQSLVKLSQQRQQEREICI